MVRTQLQFTQEQFSKLRQHARQRGISVAEVVRRCVDRVLTDERKDREELFARASGLVGSLKDPEEAKDLSIHHDRYLRKAYE